MTNKTRLFSRRDFIKLASSVPLSLMLNHFLIKSVLAQKAKPKKDRSIIIIGAGMAGLGAALELKKGGHQPIILEGHGRVGGRVMTDRRTFSMPVDLGAQWIEGSKGNPITKFAKELGIKTINGDYGEEDDIDFYGPNGEKLSDEDVEAVEEIAEELESRAERCSASDNLSIADLAKGEKLDEEEQIALNWNYALIAGELGEEPERVSCYAEAQGEEFGGEDLIFPNGYDEIPFKLASSLDVRLSHIVNKIDYSGKEVKVFTTQGEFKADQVLVTVPLGVLKSSGEVTSIQFLPALPEKKQRAIQKLEMGKINKVIVSFDKPFWPKESSFFAYLSKKRGEFPNFMNFLKYFNKPILLSFIGGDAAREMDRQDNKEVIANMMEVLKKIFGSNIPSVPSRYKIVRWGQNPWSFGAYSFAPVGATKYYEDLVTPVADKIFFAGEHCSDQYGATVHGAYLSGVKTAKEVMA